MRRAFLNLQEQAPQNRSTIDERVRRLTLINSVIGVTVAGISTRVFMISVPTLATALGTDILGHFMGIDRLSDGGHWAWRHLRPAG